MSRSAEAAEQLRDCVRALVRRMRAEVSEQGVSRPQGSVLRRLADDGPQTTADLARAELIKPQTMGALVGELEEAGMVVRTDDATDARRKLISLTRLGQRTLTTQRAERQSWLAAAIDAKLDPAEVRTLVEALALLRRIAQP